ncbi:hypothetical protein BHE74_00020446 [Ensete ventricosum]|uniref:Uncharacterized protein n=1 Tax=Ensete ventricosum TaxID=4639 RepID=A0A426YSK2_ENSVE|nr:hypothetical protein B296_00048969 [Ensete ventricosum]RWW71785.1 hypothetical protein BHE74_00020446 [Ensete ventricosum]
MESGKLCLLIDITADVADLTVAPRRGSEKEIERPRLTTIAFERTIERSRWYHKFHRDLAMTSKRSRSRDVGGDREASASEASPVGGANRSPHLFVLLLYPPSERSSARVCCWRSPYSLPGVVLGPRPSMAEKGGKVSSFLRGNSATKSASPKQSLHFLGYASIPV